MDSDPTKIIVSIIGGIISLAVAVAAVAAMIIVFTPPKRTPEQKKKARKRRALVAKRVFAKIGICVGTFFAANLLEVLLGYLIRDNTPNDIVLTGIGIPGAIPKMIFWAAAFFGMWKLCAEYNKHFEENYGKYFEEDDEKNEEEPKKDILLCEETAAKAQAVDAAPNGPQAPDETGSKGSYPKDNCANPTEKQFKKGTTKMRFGRFRNGAGGVGYVILQIALLLFSIFPIVMLGVPWWARFLIIIADYFIGSMLFGLPELALWITALIITINGRQDGWATAYYICFGLYVLLNFIIPIITALVKRD